MRYLTLDVRKLSAVFLCFFETIHAKFLVFIIAKFGIGVDFFCHAAIGTSVKRVILSVL